MKDLTDQTRNLVLCCDGTWNTPAQRHDGIPSATNVVRLHTALVQDDRQRAYYRKGVGTGTKLWKRLVGGALGEGLNDDIRSALYWLASEWRAGDRIYLFGFSRGAYTVRSLAGLIGIAGLPVFDGLDEPGRWALVEEVFRLYRDREPGKPVTPHPRAHAGVEIHFLGVWDTVGALGIPRDSILHRSQRVRRHRFHDTRLGPAVRHARHALALDETRESFAPTLWTEVAEERDVRQVWFCGVHADVGGGYVERGLADISLDWMLKQAVRLDLRVRDGAMAQLEPDARGVRHDSVTRLFRWIGTTRPRGVPDLGVLSEEVHFSVANRRRNPPLEEDGYWPGQRLAPGDSVTLEVFAAERWNRTGLFLEEGATYEMTAEGQWLDGRVRSGPEGGGRSVAYALSDLFNGVQAGRRRDNPVARVAFVRRHHDLPWFSLVGVIASGTGADDATQAICPHEVVAIGRGVTHRARSSGYFHAYANDVWGMYWNNRGKVRLTVTRTG